MNVPVILIVLAVVFVIVNLVLWMIVLLGSKGTHGDREPGEKEKESSLLESTVTEMLNIFKDVEDMINEIKEDKKRMAESRNELPLGMDESIEKYGKDIKKLNENIDGLKSNIDGLKSNIDVNSSRMENLMEELDGYLVKLSGSAGKSEED